MWVPGPVVRVKEYSVRRSGVQQGTDVKWVYCLITNILLTSSRRTVFAFFLYDRKPTQPLVNKERSAFRPLKHRCLSSIFRVGLQITIKRTLLECMNTRILVPNSVRGTVY